MSAFTRSAVNLFSSLSLRLAAAAGLLSACGGGETDPVNPQGLAANACDGIRSTYTPAVTGDQLLVSNGITVSVEALMANPKPGQGPVVCLDYYTAGGHRLNTSAVCLETLEPKKIAKSCQTNPPDKMGLKIDDYGVTASYLAATDDAQAGMSLPLKLVAATKGPIHRPRDVYDECLAQGNPVDGCLRYMQDDTVAGESELVDGRFRTVGPSDQADLVEAYHDQFESCVKRAEDLLGVSIGPGEGNLRLRYVNDSRFTGPMSPARSGLTLDNNYVLIFGSYQVSGALLETPGKGVCFDGKILHESTHMAFTGYTGNFFWSPLQEGAARTLGMTYASRINPHIYYAQQLQQGETGATSLIVDGKEYQYQFHVLSFTGDKVTVDVNDTPAGDVASKNGLSIDFSTKTPSIIRLVPFAAEHKYHLLVKVDASGEKPVVNLSVVNVHPADSHQFDLTCNADSYDAFGGIWLDGQFYRDPSKHIVGQGGKQPYVKLDGSAQLFLTYFSASCFWEGLLTAYDGAGLDRTLFWKHLAKNIRAFGEQPWEAQLAGSWCVLDEVEKILLADTGKASDLKSYAARFGYQDKKPWCESMNRGVGAIKMFGSSRIP